MKHDLGVHLLEVVTPRTNAALLSSAEHLFGALTLAPDAGPVALEIGADHERRRFLLRVSSASQRQRLAGQLGAAYPQAQLRLLDLESGVADPARLGDDEQLAACTLGLRAAPYLPLRIFGDRDLDADAGPAQADPVLGILAALADLPPGWRGLAQLVVLQPAPSDWAEPYRRLALESPLQAERAGDRGPSLVGPLLLLGLAGSGARRLERRRSLAAGRLGRRARPESAGWRRWAAASSGCAGGSAARHCTSRGWWPRSSAAPPAWPSCGWPSSRPPSLLPRRSTPGWSGSPPPTGRSPWPLATSSCRAACAAGARPARPGAAGVRRRGAAQRARTGRPVAPAPGRRRGGGARADHRPPPAAAGGHRRPGLPGWRGRAPGPARARAPGTGAAAPPPAGGGQDAARQVQPAAAAGPAPPRRDPAPNATA